MDLNKVKPLTIGIIALLLVLLVFNFVPTSKKDAKKLESKIQKEIPKQEIPQTLNETSQNNIELIQKNIDFLKENLENFKSQSIIEMQNKADSSDTSDIKEFVDSSDFKLESLELAESLNLDSTLTATESKKICKSTKPQLAIIIDDISTQAQLKALLSIDYKITPSIFPKSKATPNTPKLAKNAPFFMVHLPLEAQSFYQEGHKWLFVGDSREKIDAAIYAIKQDFPSVKYINNHTGSKFTKDKDSMEKLLKVLQKYNINFIDSKTTTNTATSAFYSKNKDALLNPCQKSFLERDVFLDNELNVTKITQNLLKAVQIAKQKGYAIAIGHPHKETFLALKNAESYLKKSGVSLVFANEINTP